MGNNENDNSKPKLISATIILLLGIILAVGYPTGGVKAPRHRTENVFHTPQRTETVKNVREKSSVKKETRKKKRIQPMPPPSADDASQDEGC